MTDTATANASGSSGQGTAGANAGGDKSTTTSVDPFAGLADPGIREWVGKAGIKDMSPQSFEAVAKTAREAQTLIGRSIQLPGEDAKPEDVDKFLSKATEKFRPKDAAGYEFKLPEGVPKEMPYDGDRAKKFAGIALEANLTSKQAQQLHDWTVKDAAEQYQGQLAKAGAATEELVKLYGKQDSDGFKSKIDLMVKGVKGAGGDELLDALRSANLLGPGDVIMSVPLAKAFVMVGERMFSEDKLVDGGTGTNTSDNPFLGTNNTLQMRAFSADPTKARRLIAAAGKKPSDFGFPDA